MIEIKFKVWYPVAEEMLGFEDGYFTLEHLMLGCYPQEFFDDEGLLRTDLLWRQYTGA